MQLVCTYKLFSAITVLISNLLGGNGNLQVQPSAMHSVFPFLQSQYLLWMVKTSFFKGLEPLVVLPSSGGCGFPWPLISGHSKFQMPPGRSSTLISLIIVWLWSNKYSLVIWVITPTQTTILSLVHWLRGIKILKYIGCHSSSSVESFLCLPVEVYVLLELRLLGL